MALPVDGPALFGVGLILVSALVALVSLRHVWRLVRVFRSPALASLDGTPAAGRLARVEGTVAVSDEQTVTAPFSGRECSVLEASAEERRLSPFGLPWFVTLWETQRAAALTLRTPETSIQVANPARTVLLAPDDVTTIGFRASPPDRIAAFEAETQELPTRTFWRDPPGVLAPIWRLLSFGTRRYTEAALEAGDEATIVGRVQPDGGVVPLVLSDRSPRRTVLGMGRTALGGLVVGAGGLTLGIALVLL